MNILRKFLDRRRQGGPIESERRRPSMADADAMLAEAIAGMEQATIRRPAFTFTPPPSANDVQRVVLFSTFSEICEYRYQNGHTVCKHPEHEAARTGASFCAEAVCPFVVTRLRLCARGKAK